MQAMVSPTTTATAVTTLSSTSPNISMAIVLDRYIIQLSVPILVMNSAAYGLFLKHVVRSRSHILFNLATITNINSKVLDYIFQGLTVASFLFLILNQSWKFRKKMERINIFIVKHIVNRAANLVFQETDTEGMVWDVKGEIQKFGCVQ
jgi:hypothetical protein